MPKLFALRPLVGSVVLHSAKIFQTAIFKSYLRTMQVFYLDSP